MVLVCEHYLHGADGASQLFGTGFTVDGGARCWPKEFHGSADGNAGTTAAGGNGGASHRIRQGVQAATVDRAVGIETGGAYLQHSLSLATTDGSDGHTVMTIEKLGIINSLKHLGFSVHGSSPCRKRGYHLFE